MKKLVIILIFFFSINVCAEAKIVFVDFNYLLSNSLIAKSMNKQLNLLNKINLDSLKDVEKTLQIKKDKIIAQKNILNEDNYNKKINNYQLELEKFRMTLAKKSEIIKKKKLRAETKILENINSILSTYAKNNSISLILDRKNILMGKSDLDITKTIIDILDKKIKTIKID